MRRTTVIPRIVTGISFTWSKLMLPPKSTAVSRTTTGDLKTCDWIKRGTILYQRSAGARFKVYDALQRRARRIRPMGQRLPAITPSKWQGMPSGRQSLRWRKKNLLQYPPMGILQNMVNPSLAPTRPEGSELPTFRYGGESLHRVLKEYRFSPRGYIFPIRWSNQLNQSERLIYAPLAWITSDSGNGLLSSLYQAIAWTNFDL